MYRISCIIPTFNRGEVLLETIGMFLTQSVLPHEIIVVDQTSNHDPSTVSALLELEKSGRICWLHEAEPNASKARNAGALAATGEIVLFLDDDIRIQPDFIASYIEVFERTKATGVAGQVLEGKCETVDRLPTQAFDPKVGWLYFRKNYSKEIATSFMMCGNVAISRSIFLALGGMDGNYTKGAFREESDFAMRYTKAGYSFIYSPGCSIHHLGAKLVRGGGARSWWEERQFWYFHHCIGDWYFNLRFITFLTFLPLFSYSLRRFVFDHERRKAPWKIPMAFGFWISALPIAAWKCFRGPALISASQVSQKHTKN